MERIGDPPRGPRVLGPLPFALLSVVIGIMAGLGAGAFRALIALFHNLAFQGTVSLSYDANLHTPASGWGPAVIGVPVIGALVVAFLVKTFAPEARGHGVPEVMDAIYFGEARIRPIVALIKALASAVSIGTGGAVGREGPIIQIGASAASSIGNWLRVPIWQRVTLVGAGAGGGIAATFNTPVGGVLFATEIMLHEVSARTLVPVVISTATATYVGRLLFGAHASFVIPELLGSYFEKTAAPTLLAYVGLGLLTGAASALFIRTIYGMEDLFDKYVPGDYYTRHGLGMLLVGVIMYLMFQLFGRYYVQGVGYATIQDVLSDRLNVAWLLGLLCLSKLLATGLTLGSGASGGVFSPSLFIGATLGAGYGVVLRSVVPHVSASPVAFAVAAMAGMVGGSTGAALTAIVMVFEMTLDYAVIVPLTITVAIAYGVRTLLSPQSIYTLKLVRRGHYMPTAMQTDFPQQQRAREIMNTQVRAAAWATPWKALLEQATTGEVSWALLERDGVVVAVLSRESLLLAARKSPDKVQLDGLGTRDFITLDGETTVFDAMQRMLQADVRLALVRGRTDSTRKSGEPTPTIDGVITLEQLGRAWLRAAELH